jgi:4-amino-4-deoxy-L-arabinose transferase-like glycosyltransferase
LQSGHDKNSAGDLRAILLCLLFFALACAAANPLLEMGVNDDWAYTHMAREFAATGQIRYNGWEAAMITPQVVWAGLFIRLFGFSFFIVRLSTMLLGAALIPVIYFLGRESGLKPSFAGYAALLTMLSPLVIPETLSFMSDVPGLFLFMVCLLSGVRAWKASGAKACLVWAGMTAVFGILAGMNRQIYLPAPILFLPAIAWMRRRDRVVLSVLGAIWLLATLAAAGSSAWLAAQPYIVTEHTLDRWKQVPLALIFPEEIKFLKYTSLTMAMLLIPLLAGYGRAGVRAVISSARWSLVFKAMAAVALAFAVGDLRLPLMGNVITQYGIQWDHSVVVGERQLILYPLIRDLLTLTACLACLICALALWKDRKAAGRVWQDPSAPTVVLGALFSSAWLGALLFRSPFVYAFDRYLMHFLPIAGVLLLRHYQVYVSGRVSRLSWGMLAVFALYGIATTHDQFAEGRARLTAARRLESGGVPRTAILAGFEYDGWTQLEYAGVVNDPRIAKPAAFYRKPVCRGPEDLLLFYVGLLPEIRARYVLALTPFDGLDDGPGAPIDYTAWLPPQRRQVFTQTVPGGEEAGCW